jgi:uncharacterized protein YrrD
MIRAKDVRGKHLDAVDGHIGSVHDLYFDDQSWTVRYLVIDTGRWLPGRKVLLAPAAISKPWHGESALPVALTKQQIESSPDIDTAQPVSRKAEQLLYEHYGWSPYWIPPGLPLPPPPPAKLAASAEERQEAEIEAASTGDAHLRSVREIQGYHLLATDGHIGSVDDFLLDDDCSHILFLSIELGEWLSRKKVLIAPRSVSEVDWANSQVAVDMSIQKVKTSPEQKLAA